MVLAGRVALPITTEQQFEIDERAAIMEFDGGLPHEEAERKARESLMSAQGELALEESKK